MTGGELTRTLNAMKTLTRGLHRLPAVTVSKSAIGMYTDPESPGIQAARSELVERLYGAAPNTVVPLDLDGVELSASCIAALLGPVLNAIVQKHLDAKFVVVLDAAGRNAWDGDAGLRKESDRLGQKLVCVWISKDRAPALLGPADEQVKATYEFACGSWDRNHGGSTARDLAEAARISIQAASNRLSRAASLGLLCAVDREPVEGGGAQYVFVPVT